MKILLIARDEWGYSGGSEQYLKDLISLLPQSGHKVVLMYARKGERPIKEKLPISAEYLIPSLNEYPSRRNIDDVKKVLRIVEDENIDVVYLCEMKNYAILRVLLKAKPTIAMLHSSIITCLRDGVKTLYLNRQICERKLGLRCYLYGCFFSKPLKGRRRLRFNNIFHAQRRLQTYRELKRVIVASQYMKNELLKHGFKEHQIIVLPCPGAFKIKKDNLSYSNNTVLFVGRIDRYKGVDILLKALTLVGDEFKARIVGEGAYLEKYKHICKKLGLENKVNFLGWVPNTELSNFYQEADLVVVPSIWPEPFAIVGLEAMAQARPVIAFNVGGISDWLEEGKTGFLIKRMDYQKMAEKITLLLSNKALARQMGLNGYNRYIAKFDKKDYIKKLTEIFRMEILK